MEVPMKVVAILIIIGIVLVFLAYFFLSIASPIISETQLRGIFAEGCLRYCQEIIGESQLENKALASVAIRKGKEIERTRFYEACQKLKPDVEFPWHCWIRDC